MTRELASLETFKEFLDYDPETGVLTWKAGLNAGKKAGRADDRGRWVFYFRGRIYFASRVAFLLMTGRWPIEEADHIDMNKQNNKWSNLREATRSQNMANRLFKGTASGTKGVYRRKGKWRAEATFEGKKRNFPPRHTIAEAEQDYIKFALEHHGEFARFSPKSTTPAGVKQI